jgi:zinc transport system substrate-binding protein
LNQSRAAIAAIAIVIPLAMLATVYTGRPVQESSQKHEKITVVASFYPLYEFASRVAGDRAEVSSLVPVGIEPHDWEPTPQDRLKVLSADMLVINGAGFERWANDVGAQVVIDTSEGIQLENHVDGINPHFWLDPGLAKYQVKKILDAMVVADPINAKYYNENAVELSNELDLLDAFVNQELANCEKSDFIVLHDAFVYFAERYDLRQHSIYGVSPEGDILPQRLQEIIELANALDIKVIYSEDLIDSRLANTIAGEIPGGRVIVLSPIESIDQNERELGIGYIEKMRENVENLKVGLECK